MKSVDVFITPALAKKIILRHRYKQEEFIIDPGQIKDIPDDFSFDVYFTGFVWSHIFKDGYIHHYRGVYFVLKLINETTADRIRLIHLVDQTCVMEEKKK